MRRFVSALVLGLAATASALAQGRGVPQALAPSATQRMVCAEAIALVKREGVTLIATGRGAPERLVRDRSFCDFSEVAELRFAPTRDNPQCPIGYRCREPGFEEWNW